MWNTFITNCSGSSENSTTWMFFPVSSLSLMTCSPFFPTAMLAFPFSTMNTSLSSVSMQSIALVFVTVSKREMYLSVSSVNTMSAGMLHHSVRMLDVPLSMMTRADTEKGFPHRAPSSMLFPS